MTTKKPNGAPAAPKQPTHLYVHGYSDEAWLPAKLAQMQELQQILQTLEQALKIRCRFWAGEERLTLEQCPVCKSGAHPDDPQRFPVYRQSATNSYYCEGSRHAISMKQLIEAVVGPENLEPFLRKLHNSPLPLTRYYIYEVGADGEEQRSVSAHPTAGIAELNLPQGTSHIRGVLIETVNAAMAAQLSGQKGSRAKLPWCERVELTPDGQLVDLRWHRAWMTEQERLLIREQAARLQLAESKRRERERLLAS